MNNEVAMKTGARFSDLVKKRYSCRSYTGRSIDKVRLERLKSFVACDSYSPFGTRPRFAVIAATEKDNEALRGLGTYGFIRGATAFITGAVRETEYDLEDYGYLMEKNILFATDLDIATCWLGGTFNRGIFSEKTELEKGEYIPAVAAAGNAASKKRFVDIAARMTVGASKRKPFNELFFNGDFNAPLMKDYQFGDLLEMVRWAPSASNKQPWRLVLDREKMMVHFYLQRSKKYYERNKKIFKMPDMQRIDMGIAMYHFEFAAEEKGYSGEWEICEPRHDKRPDMTEYIVTRRLIRE